LTAPGPASILRGMRSCLTLACLTPGLVLALGACGDDGRATAEDSAGPTSTPTTVPPQTDPTGSESEATPTDGTGSASNSESASGTTGDAPTEPTSVGPDPSIGDTTADPTLTGGIDLPGCDEEPPPGFMVAPDDACAVDPAVGMFNPVVEWHKDAWSAGANSRSSVSAPVVAQLTDDNGDGKIDASDLPEVLLITYNSPDAQTSCWLRAVSGDGATEVLNIQNAQFSRNQNLTAADIDNDGVVEILTKAKDQKIYTYEHDGTLKWTSAALGTHTAGFDSTVSVSDMNGDGVPEVITGRAILDAQGVLIGAGTHGVGGVGASMSFAVDVDADGEQEVVVGDALYNMAGADKWFNNLGDGYPAALDLDLDGLAEIAVVNNGKVRVQKGSDGSVIWDVAIPGGAGGPPTVADFDGDGLPEIGVAGKSRYTVFDTDGAALWTAITQDASSGITGSSVYDFEGDGVADVVYADEINLYVYSGVDGAVKLKFAEHNSGTRLEMPVVADVDGDGEVEIAFVSESYGGQFGPVNGVTVLGDADHSWRPGRKLWNQHAYHITNVNDDGTIPANAALNWLTYNNFRSGDLSPPDGLSAPDLQLKSPETCVNTCKGEDQLEVWVQIGNAGAAPLTAGAKIEVYGTAMGSESLLTTVDFLDVLQPGQFADAVVIPVMTTDLDSLRLVAVPNEAECNVDGDNEVVLEKPFCNAPS
jgi:uncharacterized protein GlcG (DUF336 family)